ncbi:MAG TPA: flavodoxin [Burkholderiaceae bacterium]|nr:flavodoxin [Burkholderiaceae bacterium]
MKNAILLAYYSRTGYTRKVAMEIAAACGCDVEEIRDRVGRCGPLGYARSAFEAASRFDTLLRPDELDPADYRLVIVGTPVWFWNLSSPVRTWVRRHRAKLGEVAFFCTCGSSGERRALAEFEALCGRAVASLALTDREVDTGRHVGKLDAFVAQLASTGRRQATR